MDFFMIIELKKKLDNKLKDHKIKMTKPDVLVYSKNFIKENYKIPEIELLRPKEKFKKLMKAYKDLKPK